MNQGAAILYTGLSGSGKTTLSRVLGLGRRLDGDLFRGDLSFSREDRHRNIYRAGSVAERIVRAGGVAVLAFIAPYAGARRKMRERIAAAGGVFIEVHVSTPVEECERRDPKGLYAAAGKNLIHNFTGIDDPYEAPERPELRIDTRSISPQDAAALVRSLLERRGIGGRK